MHILLIASGLLHPPLTAVRDLRKLLRTRGYPVRNARSMEELPHLDLSEYSALVLYFHHEHISPAALTAFERFVSQGGGVLAIHSATASFKQTSPYFDILGGKFTTHGKVESFECRSASHGEIFADLPAFTIEDELYIHEQRTNVTTHFWVEQEGRQVPVVWTCQFGEGRVCYACPGHTSETMKNPIYQQVLLRGLGWVTGTL